MADIPISNDEEEQAFMDIARSVVADETELAVKISIADAWFLISALQVTTRHPGISEDIKVQVREAGHQFQDAITDLHPQAEMLLERGWDERFDTARGT